MIFESRVSITACSLFTVGPLFSVLFLAFRITIAAEVPPAFVLERLPPGRQEETAGPAKAAHAVCWGCKQLLRVQSKASRQEKMRLGDQVPCTFSRTKAPQQQTAPLLTTRPGRLRLCRHTGTWPGGTVIISFACLFAFFKRGKKNEQ